MFKKILSAIGIGSADIDLVLEKRKYAALDTVSGKLVVKGGTVDQQINDIEAVLNVYSSYRSGEHQRHVKLGVGGFTVPGFTIRSGETKEIPCSFQLPAEMPITDKTTHFKIHTNLDIEDALDSSDTDQITILPSGIVQNFLEGMKLIGFRTESEGFTGDHQLFSFRAHKAVRWKLDELEFHYQVKGSQTQLQGFFEIEKKTYSSLVDHLDLNEKKGRYRFTQQDLATPQVAADTIRRFIDEHYKNLKS